MHTRSSNKCHADLPSGPHEQVGVRRLTVATVGWLGPLPPNLGLRKDIPFAAGHTAAHAPPHSAWCGPPRVWGKETSVSFRPDLRRTACGELVPRAGGGRGDAPGAPAAFPTMQGPDVSGDASPAKLPSQRLPVSVRRNVKCPGVG